MPLESQIASPSMTSSGTARWPLRRRPRRDRAGATGRGLLVVDALPAQLARDAAARAQPVRRRAAAVQRRHRHEPADARRRPGGAPKPATRSASGWRVARRPRGARLALAVPVDRVDERVLVVRGLPAELAPGLRRAEGPPQRHRPDLGDGDRRPAGQRLERRARAQRGGQRQLDRRRLDPAQPPEVGEQAVEGEVAVAEDVALARPAALVGQQVARARRPRRRRCSARRRRRPGSRGAGSAARARSRSGRRRRVPRTWAGLTITTGSPCAATRSASRSASCLALTYGRPWRRRERPGCSSAVDAARRRARSPRPTRCGRRARRRPAAPPPARCACRRRWRGTAPVGVARSVVSPATWKTRSTPRSARRTARAVEDVGVDHLDVEPVEVASSASGAHGDADAVAALDQQPRDVRADEAGAAGDAGRDAHARSCRRSRLRDAQVAVVTDTTHYLPRELRRGAGHPPGRRSTSTAATAQEREVDMPDFDALLRAAAHRARPADDLAAVDRRLPRGLRAAGRGRATTSSRSTSPAGSPAPSSPRARPRPRSPRASRGAASRSSTPRRACGGIGLVRARRRPRPRAAGADVEQVVARAHEARRRDEDLVRRRHARVPAARRAHRHGAGHARRRAEDQADPHDRRRDHAGRARAHRGPRLRAHGRLPARRARATAPTAGSSSTSRPPSRPQRLVERGREIFGSEPVLVSEIGPVIGTHVGPGLLGAGGVPRALLEF